MKIRDIKSFIMDAGRPLSDAIATARTNDERVVAAHPSGGDAS